MCIIPLGLHWLYKRDQFLPLNARQWPHMTAWEPTRNYPLINQTYGFKIGCPHNIIKYDFFRSAQILDNLVIHLPLNPLSYEISSWIIQFESSFFGGSSKKSTKPFFIVGMTVLLLFEKYEKRTKKWQSSRRKGWPNIEDTLQDLNIFKWQAWFCC